MFLLKNHSVLKCPFLQWTQTDFLCHILSKSAGFASGIVLIKAILVICWGPHGISDVSCENMQRTQEYSLCLYLHRVLYTVFVIPADGNRQKWEFHRHRKGFVGNQSTLLSLQALVSGALHWYVDPDGDQLQPRGSTVCIQWDLMRDYCLKQRIKERHREIIKVTWQDEAAWKSKLWHPCSDSRPHI